MTLPRFTVHLLCAGAVAALLLIGPTACERPSEGISPEVARLQADNDALSDQLRQLSLLVQEKVNASPGPSAGQTELMEEMSQLQRRLMELLEQQDQADGATSSADTEALEADITALTRRLVTLEAEAAARAPAEERIERLEARIDALVEANTALQTEAAQARASLNREWDQVIETLMAGGLGGADSAEIRQELNRLREQLAQFRQENQELAVETDRLTEELGEERTRRRQYERILAREDLLPRPGETVAETPEPETPPAGGEDNADTTPGETVTPPEDGEDPATEPAPDTGGGSSVITGRVLAVMAARDRPNLWDALVQFPPGTEPPEQPLYVYDEQGRRVGTFRFRTVRTPASQRTEHTWFGGEIVPVRGAEVDPAEGFRVTTLAQVGPEQSGE